MKSYYLKLINKNPKLDLIQKTTQINNCLVEIIKMGKGLISYTINKISKNSIVLTV